MEHESLPPCNVEAEEALLGSLLIDPESFFEISTLIEPHYFYNETHRWIYESIEYLHQKQRPVDTITVADRLRKLGQLDELGGEAYLMGLLSMVPTAIHVAQYANIVRGAALRRKIIGAASIAATMAYDESTDIEEVLVTAEKAIYDVSHVAQEQDLQSIKDVALSHMTYMEDINANEETNLITTGFSDLDRLLAGGFEKGSLILVVGDTGMGKSSLLNSMAVNMAQIDHSVSVFSLEMSTKQVLQRIVSYESRVPVVKLRQPKEMTEVEWSKYYQYAAKASEYPIHIHQGSASPMSIMSKSRRVQAKSGLDVIMVDYIALMDADQKTNNETLRLASISRAMKMMAADLDVVVILAAQLNSKAIADRQNKRPTLADLRFGSDANNDSDVVMLMYRDDYYNEISERPHITEINLAKNREGPTAIVDLFWQADTMSFRNLQRREISLGSEQSVSHSSKKYEPEPEETYTNRELVL